MVVFKGRKDNGRHSFIHLDYAAGGIPPSGSSYLTECGVLDVICLLPGSTTTFSEANEIDSALFMYILTTGIWGRAGSLVDMINLVYKNCMFSFKGTEPKSLDLITEDVTIDVLDPVPAQNLGRVIEYACKFLNEKYNRKYKAYPGDSAHFENKNVSVVVKFNFRLLEEEE